MGSRETCVGGGAARAPCAVFKAMNVPVAPRRRNVRRRCASHRPEAAPSRLIWATPPRAAAARDPVRAVLGVETHWPRRHGAFAPQRAAFLRSNREGTFVSPSRDGVSPSRESGAAVVDAQSGSPAAGVNRDRIEPRNGPVQSPGTSPFAVGNPAGRRRRTRCAGEREASRSPSKRGSRGPSPRSHATGAVGRDRNAQGLPLGPAELRGSCTRSALIPKSPRERRDWRRQRRNPGQREVRRRASAASGRERREWTPALSGDTPRLPSRPQGCLGILSRNPAAPGGYGPFRLLDVSFACCGVGCASAAGATNLPS